MKFSSFISLFKRYLTKAEREAVAHLDEASYVLGEEALLIKQKIEKRKRKQRKIKMIVGGLSLLVVFFACMTIYSQYRLRTLTQEELKAGTVATQPKTGEEVLKALGRHIMLPKGDPQVAIVQDASRIKDTQAFFKDVENGDVVVVFDTAIYVYRPSLDIVVNAGDISGVGEKNP